MADTSRLAAEAIRGDAPRLRSKVLKMLARFCQKGEANPPGLTDQQMQELTKLGPQTQTPRRLELSQVGVIVDSGRTRKTRANRKARVWIIDWRRCTEYVLETGDISELSRTDHLFQRNEAKS
ncbi:hypothetical protein KJ782_07035 [Patescibacteria group bacterium]|nr:hypothetical protein [Patescibacteria group bacterium]